jgi:single-strand DNA-binding protein
MLDLNRLTIIGNVSKEPRPGKTGSGDSFSVFSIVAAHCFDKKGKEQIEKIEIEVFAWNGLAEWIVGNVKKGSRLYVEGRLRLRTKPSGIGLHAVQMPEIVAERVIPYVSDTKIPKGQDPKPKEAPTKSDDGIGL